MKTSYGEVTIKEFIFVETISVFLHVVAFFARVLCYAYKAAVWLDKNKKQVAMTLFLVLIFGLVIMFVYPAILK